MKLEETVNPVTPVPLLRKKLCILMLCAPTHSFYPMRSELDWIINLCFGRGWFYFNCATVRCCYY